MTNDPLKNPSDAWGAPEYDGRRADRIGRILVFLLGAAVLVGLGMLIGGMLADRRHEGYKYEDDRYFSEAPAATEVTADDEPVFHGDGTRRALLVWRLCELAGELKEYADDHGGDWPRLTDEDLRLFSLADENALSREELKEVLEKWLADNSAPDGISEGHLTGVGEAGGGVNPDARSWTDYVAALREAGLDVVIVFDSTGSMRGIIGQLRTRIAEYTDVVKHVVPGARVGFVAYRDRKKYDVEHYEYTVKYQKLVALDDDGTERLQRFVRESEAGGGGDIPEAVYEGVYTAIEKGQWRPGAHKVIIVIGDAPARPESNGIAKINELARTWHDRTGGVVSCIDTTGNGKLLEEFRKLAAEGGGESAGLRDEQAVIRQALLFSLGSKWAAEIGAVHQKMINAPRNGPPEDLP